MGPSPPDDRGADSPLASAGAPRSFTAYSPPQQGDAVCGLTLAVAGIGPATIPSLPNASWPTHVGDADAWAIAVDAETHWCVLLSQNCDIVGGEEDEPSVLIAPLVYIDETEWFDLRHNAYSARRFAYPDDKFELPRDRKLAVDLAWSTTVLKGALTADSVLAVRPLTGPTKDRFVEWLAARFGRAPFADEVVESVLDPCYYVRERLGARFLKAQQQGGTAPLQARAVAASDRWYAHVDGPSVMILGEVTGPLLHAAGFVDDMTGLVDTELLTKAQDKLTADILKRMNQVAPDSGYVVSIKLADFAQLRASQARKFALLVR